MDVLKELDFFCCCSFIASSFPKASFHFQHKKNRQLRDCFFIWKKKFVLFSSWWRVSLSFTKQNFFLLERPFIKLDTNPLDSFLLKKKKSFQEENWRAIKWSLWASNIEHGLITVIFTSFGIKIFSSSFFSLEIYFPWYPNDIEICVEDYF